MYPIHDTPSSLSSNDGQHFSTSSANMFRFGVLQSPGGPGGLNDDQQDTATSITNDFHFGIPPPSTGSSLFGDSALAFFAAPSAGGGAQNTFPGAGITGSTFGDGNSLLSSPPIIDATPTENLRKWECIEELLRKFLLGEELVNTQFHLFSAKSSMSGRVVKPRVLCAHNALLAKSSTFFLDLLNTDVRTCDASLVDLVEENDVPSDVPFDDYGYESDSDLDECDEPIQVADPKAMKNRVIDASDLLSDVSADTQAKDSDELSKDSSDSFHTCVVSPVHSRKDESSSVSKDGTMPVASRETAVQAVVCNGGSRNQTVVRPRSLGSRHILVKDTASQTWYCLLNYLYTGKFNFLPLSSTQPGRKRSSSSFPDDPRCSAKSMYRLASKVGVDHLRDEAFSYIRSNLNEHNIIQELSCNIVSKYPQLLAMELDVFSSHLASPAITLNFAPLSRRIADNEFPHGADIINTIYQRFLFDRLNLVVLQSSSMPNLSGTLELGMGNVARHSAPER